MSTEQGEAVVGSGKFSETVDEEPRETQESEEELASRALAGIIIAGVGLGADAVNSILNGLGSVNRKVVISFANNTSHSFSAINVYFFSGTSDYGLAGTIPAGSTLGFGARKTAGPVARGTVGVLTYYIPNLNQTACIMWSVPFDYNLYSNWWNFELRSGRVQASRSLYNDLYYTDNAILGDSNHVQRTTMGRRLEGSMGHSGTPLLEIVLH